MAEFDTIKTIPYFLPRSECGEIFNHFLYTQHTLQEYNENNEYTMILEISISTIYIICT